VEAGEAKHYQVELKAGFTLEGGYPYYEPMAPQARQITSGGWLWPFSANSA
jgi:hypothetical protein